MFARTARWIFLIAVCAGLFLGRVSRHGHSANEALAEARDGVDANYESHQDLTSFRQSDGSAAPIKTASDWQQRRKQILAGGRAGRPLPSRLPLGNTPATKFPPAGRNPGAGCLTPKSRPRSIFRFSKSTRTTDIFPASWPTTPPIRTHPPTRGYYSLNPP